MNSKERIKLALNHQQPDKVPFDLGAGGQTGMHISCVAALRDYYGLEKRPVKTHEPFQMLGYFDEDLKQSIGVDVDGIFNLNTMFGIPAENWKPFRMDNGLEILVPGDFNTKKTEKGDTLIYPEGDITAQPSAKMPKDGYFFDNINRQKVIDNDNLNPTDNLEEFGLISDKELKYLEVKLDEVGRNNRATFGYIPGTALGDIALVPGPSLKDPKGIRDIEEWYISTITRKDYIHKIFEKQTDIALSNLKKIYETVGNKLDIVFICGTDFGTQTSTFCSVATFNELYKPYYKIVNDWIHKNTSWKTFKHCCGAVESFMEHFIGSGFDIINPVQCSATGMDPKTLKEKYGDRLVFWGGGVDTQKTLPFGKPEEVRKEVLERCEIFSKNGGFIFNSIHNIQAKTPVENIVAMINSLHEFNS